ncbi:uncharacterized protein LOC132048919 [Lycium ferocissimum]|uniref:uncharacterized protein LOC132048919 n=1 Tax=Lycium ferocissimum TaxID=112874 RepID=UPI0028164252|nr:uncharacterized protein LOC132048919 [Lycium ferocissimum]
MLITFSNTWRPPLSLLARLRSHFTFSTKCYIDEECNDFLPWLEHKAGVEISSLLSIGKSAYGRSLIARHPIKPGDFLLKVPYNVQLAPDNLPRGIDPLLGDNVGNVAKVALLILYEQKLGKKSKWAPYITCLPRPEDMHSTIFWDENELEMIQQSSLHQKTIMHKLFVEQEFLTIKEVRKGSISFVGLLLHLLLKFIAVLLFCDNIIGKGHVFDRLYILDEYEPRVATYPGVVSLFEAHCRFGHPSLPMLKKLCPQFQSISSLDYESCQFAKHHRSTLDLRVNKRVESAFELIHSDVWGPCPIVSKMGHNQNSIQCYDPYKTQFNATIRTLRSDNAKEYMSESFHSYMRRHGILHQSSCVDTPSQNGVAERKNRHLLETTQALLFQMKVPKQFWADVVSTACFLINHMPSTVLVGNMPYSVLFPNKSLFPVEPKVFGSTCYVRDVRPSVTKLDPKALKCVFLGYSRLQKGYRCYSTKLGKYLVLNDVVFSENTPFFYRPPNSTSQGEEDEWLVYQIPFADFANHSDLSDITVLGNEEKQLSEVIANCSYAPGDQVLIRYGKFSNARLLLDFGFTLPCNMYDQVQVELTIPHEDKLRQLKLELLSRHQTPILKDVNGFSSSENSFALKEVRSADAQGRGIPQSIRAFARVLCSNSQQEINYLAVEAAGNDGRLARRPLKDKSREIQAHQFLLSKITELIEEYNASIKSLELRTLCMVGKLDSRRQIAQYLLTGELCVLKSAALWLENYCATLFRV